MTSALSPRHHAPNSLAFQASGDPALAMGSHCQEFYRIKWPHDGTDSHRSPDHDGVLHPLLNMYRRLIGQISSKFAKANETFILLNVDFPLISCHATNDLSEIPSYRPGSTNPSPARRMKGAPSGHLEGVQILYGLLMTRGKPFAEGRYKVPGTDQIPKLCPWQQFLAHPLC